MLRIAFHVGCVALLLGVAAASVRGSSIAYDNAGDSAYNNGWDNASNGGYGWDGGWILTEPSDPYRPSAFFIGSSSTNGTGDPQGTGDINTPRTPQGRAWGISNTSRYTGFFGTSATRRFSGPLMVGETFSIDIDPGFSGAQEAYPILTIGASDGSGGFQVEDYATNYVPYALFSQVGKTQTQVGETSFIAADQGAHIDFTRTLTGYHVDFKSLPTGSGEETFNFAAPYVVDAVSLSLDYGFSSDSAFYANNIQITPEPSMAVVASLIGIGLLLIRRRRSRFFSVIS